MKGANWPSSGDRLPPQVAHSRATGVMWVTRAALFWVGCSNVSPVFIQDLILSSVSFFKLSFGAGLWFVCVFWVIPVERCAGWTPPR